MLPAASDLLPELHCHKLSIAVAICQADETSQRDVPGLASDQNLHKILAPKAFAAAVNWYSTLKEQPSATSNWAPI